MPFYTEEERKQAHYFMGRHFEFFTCSDLSIGVTVKPIVDNPRYYDNKELLAKDISSFTANWCHFTAPKLNGFSGLDTIKWKFK